MMKNATTTTHSKAGIKSICIKVSIHILQICDYCIFPFTKQPIKATNNKEQRITTIFFLYFLIKRIVLTYSIGAIYFIINMTIMQLQSSIAIFVKVIGGDKIKIKIPIIV